MPQKQHLIIINGIITPNAMLYPLIRFMKKHYTCHLFSYSVKETLPSIVNNLHQKIKGLPEFHSITYSFGAIVLRNYVSMFGNHKINRAVMVVPPNKGSELLRNAMNTFAGKLLFNKLCEDFVRNESSYLPGTPKIEAGVIAGTVPHTSPIGAINKLISRLFDTTDSDGKVKIHETALPYPHETIFIKQRHDMVVRNRECFEQAHYFLQNGRFNTEAPRLSKTRDHD